MTITYNIQNVTPGLARSVMLRKFFQMVFMGNDRRSLHIYTATVIGASAQDKQTNHETFLSDLGAIPEFRMKFSFLIGNTDNNEIDSVVHEDITDGTHGFLDEIERIRKVWGDECDIIFDDQSRVAKLLRNVQRQESEEADEQLERQSAVLTNYKLLWTKQSRNGTPKPELSSLSIHGDYKNVPEETNLPSRDDIAKKASYTIGVPDIPSFPKGLELVNWVRTTIQFKFEIDDNNFNYTLRRNISQDDETRYLAPDFTWYFSPVVKSYIDNHNSIVEVKRTIAANESACTCPIQKNKKVFVANDKSLNCIDAVPNKMTVDFHYWTEEKIRLRQKYRLAAREILPTAETFDSLNEINIFLDTADEHSRGNRQFITSILLSFALAFGIDSARLAEVSPYFGHWLPADVMWLALLVVFALALINTPVTQNDSEHEKNSWKLC